MLIDGLHHELSEGDPGGQGARDCRNPVIQAQLILVPDVNVLHRDLLRMKVFIFFIPPKLHHVQQGSAFVAGHTAANAWSRKGAFHEPLYAETDDSNV